MKKENAKLYKLKKMINKYRSLQNFERVDGKIEQLTNDTGEYFYLLGKKSVLNCVLFAIDSLIKEN